MSKAEEVMNMNWILPVKRPWQLIAVERQKNGSAASCVFELLVPHAVDEGAHSWRHQRVQNCFQYIQEWEGGGGGFQVSKKDSADKEKDHQKVRETHGKRFVPSLLRGDPAHNQ